MSTRIAGIVLVLCALPLCIYPGIFMAGIMGLAAPPNPNTPWLKTAVAGSFLRLSLLYPVAYGVACSVAGAKSRTLGAVIASVYLAICLALMGAWWALDQTGNEQ